MNIQTVAPRVLAEFNEMPGMVLTLRQGSAALRSGSGVLPGRDRHAGRFGLPAADDRGSRDARRGASWRPEADLLSAVSLVRLSHLYARIIGARISTVKSFRLTARSVTDQGVRPSLPLVTLPSSGSRHFTLARRSALTIGGWPATPLSTAFG